MPAEDTGARASLRNLLDDIGRQTVAVGHMRVLAAATIAIDERVELLEAKVDRRFDEVDKRFVEVDKRFVEVDRRFDALDIKIGLVADDTRKTAAQVERLVGYIIRDELKEA
jgi:hypothetical protein